MFLTGKRNKMKRKISGILFGLLFLIGFGILAYPTVSNQWNTYRQSRLISNYEQVVSDMQPEDYTKEWEAAREFDSTLVQNNIYGDVFGSDDVDMKDTDYWTDGIIFAILLWKHNRWWMLYLLVLLGSSPILSGYFPLHFLHREEVPDSNQLKLVCWNAEGFRLNKDTLAKAIHSIRILQPGIVCLQERPHTNLLAWDTIRAAFPDYPYCIVNSREDEILNLAVFSRWPVGNVQEYYFPDSYNKMLQADIRMIGQTFRLFNVHLQTTGMNESSSMKDRLQTMRHHAIRRNRQADLLANAIAESLYPVIVCGDFNDTPASYVYRKISRSLQDCFLQAGRTWKGSYQRWGDFLRIDYTLCSPAFQVNCYQLVSNPWSDHKQQHCVLYLDKRY